MIAQGKAEAIEAVNNHLNHEALRTVANDETDRMSHSAKLAFIEAYESLFDRNNIPYNKTSSVWFNKRMIDFKDSFFEQFTH